VFCNVKIVENRDIPLCLAKFKNLNVLNVIVCINPKTTVNSVDTAKLMKKPCYLVSKLKKTNHAHMSLSVLIVVVITR